MNYLRYYQSVEHPEAGEQDAIDSIIQGMIKQSETVAKREHHAVRASHAKSTGLATGTLTVRHGLPEELSQGLFKSEQTYPVAVRFAQGPGETLGDRVSTHRGMSVKVFDVEGEKLAGHGVDTQDLVFATGTTFPSGTAQGFARDAKMIGMATPMSEGVKSVVAAVARQANRVLHAFGGESPRADFFGHPFAHPLADAYFSQCPMRYGDYVAKLGLFPVIAQFEKLKDWSLDPTTDENGFRHAVIDYFSQQEVRFELKAQLWADAEKQPIEDASIDWPTEISHYRTIADIVLPMQDAFSAARQHYFDDVMTFRPAHSLVVHKPLGSAMRARLQVYQALSEFRHRSNHVMDVNTAKISDIPA